MFYERLTSLCARNQISLSALVEKELKMSVSNVTKWKNGNVPKIDTVNRIANYFDVSVDSLLGNEQKNKPATESDERTKMINEILDIMDSLPDELRDIAMAQLRILASSSDNIKK